MTLSLHTHTYLYIYIYIHMASCIIQTVMCDWVLVPRGGVYTYEDLRVGRSISIYSRVFRIIGADDYTRKFYKARDFAA